MGAAKLQSAMGAVNPCCTIGYADITSQCKMSPTFSARRPFWRTGTSIDSQWCGPSSSMHLLLFCERKLLHLLPNNYRHPFFQTNCKSIMAKPINVSEFDIFFWRSVDHLPIFAQIPSKTEFRFSAQNAKFRDFVHFLSKTILFSLYWLHKISPLSPYISKFHDILFQTAYIIWAGIPVFALFFDWLDTYCAIDHVVLVKLL